MEPGSGKKRVILLGATGSIGRSTLQVVENLPDELEVVALAAGSRWELIADILKRHSPRAVALTDPAAADALRRSLGGSQRGGEDAGPIRVHSGPEGLVRMVEETAAEVVVGAISGAAGLPASVAALQTGKDLALANKESMVCAGRILNQLSRERGRSILPVDSEHSAIFQCLRSGRPEEVRSLILTASG